MSRQIKPDQLEAGIKHMLSQVEPRCERLGTEGVVHRAMAAILPGSVRWSANEYDRLTPPDERMEALAVICANMVCTELSNVDCPDDVKFSAVNEFLTHLAHRIGHIMTVPNAATVATLDTEEVGHG